MASQPHKLHIFFFPLMAPGHIIPMLNLAKIFTLRGVGATVLATPTSTPFLRDTVDRARDSGYSINLLVLPSSSSSSPSGAENLTSPEMSPEFFAALESFRQPLDRVLREHRPSCIVSDMFMPFTEEVANGLNIPRLVFHSMGFFPLCVIDSVDRSISNGSISIDDDKDTIVVPGLPHRIEMKRSQLHNPTGARNKFSEFMERVNESELKSYGAVVNSFYELEPEYADHYRSTMGRKARCVGPVSLIDSEASTVEAQRDSVVAWLDSKPPRSVVYVSFGSLSRLTEQQLREIACGLESSGHFYVWVVRSRYDSECRHDNEKGKGVIVEGWAPQQAILRHAAVGGFVTHCGWNAVMESAEAGVPMVTWPMFAEQFYNERLVVEVAGIGVGVGAEEWGKREEEKSRRGVVGREEIRRAVCCVMDGGDAEGERVRRRAEELREKARRSMEAAGSSYSELDRLIDELNGLRS